jgi:hypothetical protein
MTFTASRRDFVADTDWCIEGNARAARDNGYLPIVIGDATGTQKPVHLPARWSGSTISSPR